MKKWILTPLLGSLLLGGSSAIAQPQDDPPAAQAGTFQVQGVSSGSGAIVVTGGAIVPAAVPPGATSITVMGSGTIASPGAKGGPVIIGQAGLPAPGQPLPHGPAVRRAAVYRGPGAQLLNVPPTAVQVQGMGGNGPVWITSATATLAGKTEKAAYMGVYTSRPSATLRSQLKLKAGLVVEQVEAKTPAEAAGLQVHDIVEKCDDQWLINPAQFVGLIRMYKQGDTVLLAVIRHGERKTVSVKLEERETYALDDDGDAIYARPGMRGPNNSTYWINRDAGGPVQQITAGARRRPLAPGFVATFGDDKQRLLITIRDGHQILTVTDPTGKQVFQGPIDTPEQRKLVPQDALKKMEEMEKIKVRIRGGFGLPEMNPETPPTP